MPRNSLPKLSSITRGSFEQKRKNPISLRDDEHLDNHFKPLKIANETSSLSLAKGKVKLEGDIFLDGDIQSALNLKFPEFIMYHPSISAGESDYFYIRTKNAGGIYLNAHIGTVDSDGSSWLSHMYIEPDGNLYLEPTNEQIWIPAETKLYFGGNTYIYESADDVLDFTVGNKLMLKITEVSSGGDQTDYIEIIDSPLVLDSGEKLVLDGSSTGGTHIIESADGKMDFYCDSANLLRLYEGTGVGDFIYLNGHVSVEATGKLSFDGNGSSVLGHTYIVESSDDVLDFYVGADKIISMTESGTDGNSVSFTTACAGFTQLEPTFDATDTEVDFRHSNKQKLTLTDNCADIHFQFPLVSGNFICVLLQDGTGGRTISNWKTKDNAGNAGDGNSGLVLWAGGTAPSNTETADKADIASIYWDADNEIAYGTYTYNF